MIDKFLHLIDRISVLDIGCSGGFEQVYLNLPHTKRNLIGIDISKKEVEQLRIKFSDSTFYNYEIVKSEFESQNSDFKSNYPLHRTLAYLQTSNYKQSFTNEDLLNFSNRKLLKHINFIGKIIERFDKGNPPIDASFSNLFDKNSNHFYSYHQSRMGVYSEKSLIPKITIDDFVNKHKIEDIDFLKIDTDGTELNVLEGGMKLLDDIIGLKIEVQFHGLVSTNNSTFNLIDNLLQKKNFSLVDLQVVKYDRFSLPGNFSYPEIPANTNSGPIMWGDAYYIKTNNNPNFFKNFESSRTLKLVYWLSNIKLYALAAEVLIENRSFFNSHDLVEIYRALLELNYENHDKNSLLTDS
jgi:hypothetical protein